MEFANASAGGEQPIAAPPPTDLKAALRLGLLFAAIKLAVDIAGNILAQHFGYGIFRDEMYYIVCGRRLAWGYVDQAPMVALQARLATALFGFHNLALLRLFSGIAGTVKIVLTGLLAAAMGGRRMAQALAMTAVLIAPVYLGIDSFLSMNAFEPVFWMGCVLAILWMVRGGDLRWWIAVGVCGGLGLLNKPSIAFFLAALFLGLLLTPQRRLLFSLWALLALLLVVGLSLPYTLWQIHHHWPTLEWLENVKHSHKNVVLGPLAFLEAEIQMLHPLSIFLLLPGLAWLLFFRGARGLRWVGLSYLICLAIMIHLHAKDYYFAPVYPMLFAAGAVSWQRAFSASRKTAWLLPAAIAVFLILGAVTLPMALPVLPPATWVRYTRALHLTDVATETASSGQLPQFYADRFGWQQMAAEVGRIYNALPPQERARTAIFCDNYGEAGAIDLFGPKYGLPPAISGHQNYFFWGPRGYDGQSMIVVGETKKELQHYFSSVTEAGSFENRWAMPYENGPIYLCHGPKEPLAEYWPHTKNWY